MIDEADGAVCGTAGGPPALWQINDEGNHDSKNNPIGDYSYPDGSAASELFGG
jgi:hypothetical protein